MKKLLTLGTLSLTVCVQTWAQGPVAYMDGVMADQRRISENYLGYNSSIAHGKSARKVEKTRAELISSVKSAMKNTERMGDYNGDASLKNAVTAYLDLTLHVLNDDYAKIVDMEEISEQSYDHMEAYMTAMELVNQKMSDASDVMQTTYEAFAAANNVTLIKSEDDLDMKIKKMTEVNTYYNKAFLIFFKSYKQHVYLMTALQEQKTGSIEQNRSQLQKDAQKSAEDLRALGAFKGDQGLNAAGQKLFDFYQKQCTELIPPVMDYYMKNERFAEQKKQFDALTDLSKEDVDNYNKAVNELNAAVNSSNKASQEMNSLIAKYTNDWNAAVSNFMGKHMPRSK